MGKFLSNQFVIGSFGFQHGHSLADCRPAQPEDLTYLCIGSNPKLPDCMKQQISFYYTARRNPGGFLEFPNIAAKKSRDFRQNLIQINLFDQQSLLGDIPVRCFRKKRLSNFAYKPL